jgi:hypothetical protein
LGYPRAALFGFCVALVAYIILCVIKTALGSVHGAEVIKNQVSGYYIADEISATYRGMMIAIDYKHWLVFQKMTITKFVNRLKTLAENVKLSAYQNILEAPRNRNQKGKAVKISPMCLRLK